MIHSVHRSIALTLLLTSLHAWAAGSIQVIAVNDGEGRMDGERYTAFSEPVLNEAGQVAFVGFRETGGFGEPDQAGGIYIGDARGSLVKLIGVGDPGFVSGSTVSFFVVGGINDSGQVAYRLSSVSESGEFLGSGLYLDAVDSLPVKVVEKGDLDPDGDMIEEINFTDLDSEGRIALRLGHPEGNASNALRSAAIFEPGGLRILAKEDQPAPDGVGVVRGVFFSALNDAGQIHYSPRIKRPGLEERPALFRETPGVGRELLFRSEDPSSAPDIDGTLLLESYTPSMNESGALIFAGNISGATDPSNNGRGLFVVDAPGSVVPLVREGHAVPGDQTIAGFGRASLNQSGDAAFYAVLTDDPAAPLERDNVGLYLRTANGLTEIARGGQPVPGGDGMFTLPIFNVQSAPYANTRPGLNDTGQVAFQADLTGTPGGGGDEHAIYFYDGDKLIEIARTGSPLLNSTIVELGLKQSAQNDGDEEIGFNDSGQIAFRFALQDDREGIAIWSPGSVATSIKLTITPAASPATGLDFEWDSKPGMFYDVVTSRTLESPIPDWQVYVPGGGEDASRYRDIPSRSTVTRLTSVPLDGARRFFAVVEKETPQGK